MRFRRPLFLVPILLLLVGGAAFAAVKVYLSSDYAVDRAVERLQAIYGGKVQVTSLDVGMDQATVIGLSFFEADESSSAEPWLKVGKAQTDISLWDFALDNARPSVLNLHEAAVTLRFDKKGHLLTRLPKTARRDTRWPRILFHQGSVTLRQEGRPDMLVQGVQATVVQQENGLVLEGTVSDPYWNEWEAQGLIDPDTTAGHLKLTAAPLHVDQAKLKALPFIHPDVWEKVHLEGDTSVDFTLDFQLSAHTFGYRVETHPVRTKVRVVPINLDADQAWGTVVVKDGIVYLKDLKGQTSDGDIHASGELHCKQEPKEMQFAIDVDHVDLRRLPSTWHLPPQVFGRLTGHADLHVTVTRGIPKTLGAGQGTLREARIYLVPTKPFDIVLKADQKGFQFIPHFETGQNQTNHKDKENTEKKPQTKKP